MSKHYLLLVGPEDIDPQLFYQQKRVSLVHSALNLQVDDIVFLVRKTDKNIYPFACKILAVNRNANTLTLQLEEIYNRLVNFRAIADLNREWITSLTNMSEQDATLRISISDFEDIFQRMGGGRMEEKVLLEHLQRYIAAHGYYFEDETLYNYHICLKTRPFVILAGLSGTGKSKLSQLYAEALGQAAHYLRLPVSPGWNDEHSLLGYLNTLTQEYIPEPATEFIVEANADEDNLYFFCLDEMNLAHVEYYFSQFLSAMEEDQAEKRQIILMSKKEHALASRREHIEGEEETDPIPARLRIPTNLFFTGTINVDETTQPISDKVIDRANTLEFFTVDLEKVPLPAATPPDPIPLSMITWQSYRVDIPDTNFRQHIVAISKILNKANLGLGYRVLRDIELYIANSKDLLDPLVAFDLQIKQRILPRIRGTEVISSMLEDLHTFLKQNNLSRSEQRLDEMKSRLKRDGYTSFWR